MTRKISLEATAREQLDAAERSAAKRSARTVVGGHEYVMRQTVVALVAGSTLAEHENPGEASLYVLNGRVQLSAGTEKWEARAGDLLEIPPVRHSVHALDNSAILLTAVPRARGGE